MTEPTPPATHPARVELEQGTHYLCACGASKNQPFCDGSHKGTGISPTKFEVTEAKKTVSLCNCELTGKRPFCDGSHHKLD